MRLHSDTAASLTRVSYDNSDGALLRTFDCLPHTKPAGIIVDECNNQLYVAMFGSNAVVAFDLNHQTPTMTVLTTDCSQPYNIALSRINAKHLWVTDQNNNRLLEIQMPGFQGWIPDHHQFYPQQIREQVNALMMCNRFGDVAFSALPRELVYVIIAFAVTQCV
jgi:hypothetical protein